MVQIETAYRVEHAEEIMSVDGVDGCWIGPKDLARSMGVDLAHAGRPPGARSGHPEGAGACRKTNKIPGIDGDAETAGPQRWLGYGFQFVNNISDAGLLLWRQSILANLRRSA